MLKSISESGHPCHTPLTITPSPENLSFYFYSIFSPKCMFPMFPVLECIDLFIACEKSTLNIFLPPLSYGTVSNWHRKPITYKLSHNKAQPCIIKHQGC